MRTLLLLIVTVLCTRLHAGGPPEPAQQRDDIIDPFRKHTVAGLVVGAHQWNYTWVEAGFSYARYRNGSVFGYRATTFSAFYNPVQQRVGMSFSRWRSHFSLVVTGFRVYSYTDFSTLSCSVQPQAGLGNGQFALCYGYAFHIVEPEFSGLNMTHEISFRFNFELKELERERWWKRNKS